VLVILNPANKAATARFRLKPAFSQFELLAGMDSDLKLEGKYYQLTIPGGSYSIYQLGK